jgi:hypothetical protein
MVTVNLLPPGIIHRRLRRRRLRRWAVVVAVVAGLATIPIGLDLVQAARAAALDRRVAPARQKLAATREHVKTLSLECQELKARIARADALRAKRRWAGLLTAITGQMSDELWLDSAETVAHRAEEPARRGSKHSSGAVKDGEVVTIPGPTHLKLTGYALRHERLYEFMSALKGTGVFKTIELTQAGQEPVLQGTAVRFVIECAW